MEDMNYRVKNDSIIDADTGEIIADTSPKFLGWTRKEYEQSNIKYLVAQEATTLRDDILEVIIANPENYLIEEKYDGHRGVSQFTEEAIRVFSRNISKKTDWFSENTDQLPHIRDFKFPKELLGTVLDSEVLVDVPNCDCRVVQSVTGSLPDKAVKWQEEHEFAYLSVFDILYYKGYLVANLPLWKRKLILANVLEKLDPKIFRFAPIGISNGEKLIRKCSIYLEENNHFKPFKDLKLEPLLDKLYTVEDLVDYYKKTVGQGKEGLMLKPMDGAYLYNRGLNYLKMKPELTFDVVIMGYDDPEYFFEGKTLREGGTWSYWEDAEDDGFYFEEELTAEEANEKGFLAITKYTYMNWIGAVRFGVWVEKHLQYFMDTYGTDYRKVMAKLKKKGLLREGGKHHRLLVEVGKTSGMNEDIRKQLSEDRIGNLDKVIEVKAQRIIDPSTGSLQHPRFSMFRPDKNSESCTFEAHLIAGGIDCEK